MRICTLPTWSKLTPYRWWGYAAIAGWLISVLVADANDEWKIEAKKPFPLRDEAIHLDLRPTSTTVAGDVATVVVAAYLHGEPTAPLSKLEDWYCFSTEWSVKYGRGIGQVHKLPPAGTPPGEACGADTITRSFLKTFEFPAGHTSGDIEVRLNLRDRRGRAIASGNAVVLT